ncbi:TPA: hypothetical protein DEP34_03230 [Candidatus Uhrbacteria bacterium]|nr:hypothetical protein [Candidatus Uhrbacteria bacterium]
MSSDEDLDVYKKSLKACGLSKDITKRRKGEIFIFELLASTHAIQSAFTKSPLMGNFVLDALHAYIYSVYSEDEKDQTDFEELLNERYKRYRVILASDGDMVPFFLGAEFAANFFGEEAPKEALPFILTSAEVFFSRMTGLKEFLDEILLKYEIIPS